ncbi:hypothetical protein NQ317_011574 [Molorchus minor]|uniref:Endonuclease/exonuclease/phosphatase domain-containing protein n=1 Tax=Molorchus minor TaxID=1323400 RepID=A0ABQ9IV63_9CUCU|nr:hypothetical protein NQ317_011574 [Molorchus minor]
MITESGLSEDITNEELFPSSYLVFRSDRNLRATGHERGGGVLIAVKKELNVVELKLDSIINIVPSIDAVGCKVTINNTTLLIFALYIPPPTLIVEYELFLDTFEKLSVFESDPNILICGDFNINKYISDSNDTKVRLINNFMAFLDVKQYNTVLNANERLLDLILGNFKCDISRDDIPIVKEDRHHPSLAIDFQLDTKVSNNFSFSSEPKAYNFKKSKFPAII